MSRTNQSGITRYFSLACLIITGLVLVYTLRGFIDGFLGAIIIYVIGRPAMRFLTERKHWNKNLSALFIIIFSFILVIVPIILVIEAVLPKLNLFLNDSSIIVKMLYRADGVLKTNFQMSLLTEENINHIRTELAGYITQFLGESVSMLGNIALMFFTVFYLLKYTGNTEKFLEKALPLNENDLSKFSKELHDQTFSNVIGAPLLALIQGLVASLGYWIFGLQDPLFWGLMTGFFSFLPMVGSSIIWIPAGLYHMTEAPVWQGIAIILFGVAVISVVDNVLRFLFQKRFAGVHPLVTVFGVIAGVSLFGITGIIFGPLLVSYFIILLKIYLEEFTE